MDCIRLYLCFVHVDFVALYFATLNSLLLFLWALLIYISSLFCSVMGCDALHAHWVVRFPEKGVATHHFVGVLLFVGTSGVPDMFGA